MEGATERLRRRISVARRSEPADLVLAGGRVLSVFTGELLEVDVAIVDGHVAGLGRYEGLESVDCSGLILLPGFIDGHMHIESTKLMVDQFARAVLPWGTTTVILDPHEIANVFGLRGVRALLRAAEGIPLDYFVMASSCVPASPFEKSAETVTAEDIERFLAEEPRALGVAEMMNFPAVVAGEDDALAKLGVAERMGRHVDGHAPGLSGAELNAYMAAGVGSDHECTTLDEALEKRRLGMWVMIREGSAARNLEALLPMVLQHGPANTMLVTDDREPDQLLDQGHVNDVIRRAVALGCPPADAVVMATLHPARYHGLRRHGALAPGSVADVVAVEDLAALRPVSVWKRGRLVAERGRPHDVPRAEAPSWMRDSVRVRVIGIDPGEIVTRALIEEPRVRDGEALAEPERDLAKVAVIERHTGSGRIGLGFVRGFGLRRGALASTQAHDAHNLVVIGVDDADMAAAATRLAEIGGGQVAVAGGRVAAELPCPIGGLISGPPAEDVAAAGPRPGRGGRDLRSGLQAAFMMMSFLALSVIPELKITDLGLVDTVRFELVSLRA